MSETLEFIAGALFVPKVREAVSKLNFDGHNLILWEGNGFFQKPMAVKGDAAGLKIMEDWLHECARKLSS